MMGHASAETAQACISLNFSSNTKLTTVAFPYIYIQSSNRFLSEPLLPFLSSQVTHCSCFFSDGTSSASPSLADPFFISSCKSIKMANHKDYI
jgi:hypothetical protein